MPDYVFDTTVLSNFAAAGRLDLLGMRYRGAAFTTAEVTDELRRGVKAGYSHLESVLQQIETINPAL
jgi:predicted nucleic acid-binding protein